MYEGQLSNIEVMQMLRARGAESSEASLTPCEKQLWEYLKDVQHCPVDREIAMKFLETLEKFDLSNFEKLQLLNAQPTQHVELYLLLESCDDRFSEKEVEGILAAVKQFMLQNHVK